MTHFYLLIDAEFFADGALPFGYIRKAGVIENTGDGITHITHHQPQAASLLVRTAAWFVGHLADTFDWSDRTVQHAKDLTERDLTGRPGQVIPAADAHFAVEQSRILERQKDLLKELGRDLLAKRDRFDLHHLWGIAFISGFRQCDHCPKTVFTAFG